MDRPPDDLSTNVAAQKEAMHEDVKQADTEQLIREVTERIDALVADHANGERRREPRP